MQLSVKGGASVDVAEQVFGADFKPALIHQIITAYMAGARAGTKANKNRSAVSGGGAKPWRQKGSGRARAGTIRSPLWRSGGVTFAASPRDYTQKVNRKMYRGALRSILSELVRQERMIVVDDFSVDAPKTKALLEKLSGLGVGTDVLIVVEAPSDDLFLAARNVPGIAVAGATDIDPVSLVRYGQVVASVGAIKMLEGRLA